MSDTGQASFMDWLANRIAEWESQRDLLTANLKDLDRKLEYARGLHGTLSTGQKDTLTRTLPGIESGHSKSPAASRSVSATARNLRGLKIKEAARLVLQEEGPLTNAELTAQLIAGGLDLESNTPEASVATSMRRAEDLFVKVGRNWQLRTQSA